MSQPVRNGGRRRSSPATLVAAGVLILIPVIATLWVGLYNQASPHLWGIPFFYWYQLLLVILVPVFVYSAYALLGGGNGRGGGDR